MSVQYYRKLIKNAYKRLGKEEDKSRQVAILMDIHHYNECLTWWSSNGSPRKRRFVSNDDEYKK